MQTDKSKLTKARKRVLDLERALFHLRKDFLEKDGRRKSSQFKWKVQEIEEAIGAERLKRMEAQHAAAKKRYAEDLKRRYPLVALFLDDPRAET